MKLNVQVGDTLTFAPFIRGWDTTATNITTTFTQGKLGSVELMPSYFDSNNYMIYYDTNYLNYQGKTAPYPNQKGRHRAPRLFPGFRYIASGTSGIDSFTFKVTTSIDSTLTTTCLIRITPPEPGNMLVLLVVNQVIYPSVQTEVNRLASDLQNEGYKTEIVPFPNLSGTAADGKRLWDTISVRYNNRTQIMAGAILIGKLPTARDGWLADGADGSFWSMTMWASEADSAMLGNRVGVGGYGGGWYTPGHLNIWVSRMGCDPYYTASYGSETVLLKRVLQSNHDYRTGASRLPRTAFFNKIWAPKLLDGNKLSDVWPTVNLRPSTDTTPFHLKEFRMGGEVFDLSAEGNYAYYARPCRITINDFYNSHFPIRFWLSSACHSGNGGGFLNQAAMIKNSGNVLAVGPTQYCGAYGYLGPMFGLADTSAVLPPRVRMRGYLKEGNNFGRAWIRANACIFASMFYGDLSLSPNMTPENQKPVIVPGGVTAVRNGLSWKFTVTATDAENGIVGYDWYAHGYNKGMADPDSSSRRNTFSYTFNSSDSGKICTLRVEVVDTFKARDYADLILKTDSAVIGLIQGQYTFAEDTSSKDELTATDPLLSPNPFNPGTAIHFGAFANNINPIHMDVFSASGKLVHRLTLPAGTKSAIWNGRDSRGNSVGNGIYLFRIVSGKSVKKIRGILVK